MEGYQKRKQSIQHNTPIRKEDRSWSRSEHEKTESFAEHLEKVFKPSEMPGDDDQEEEIQGILEEPLHL
jgi:hypothetical protein